MQKGSLRRICELDRMIRLGRLTSAAKAASELDVTRRTIERDLELLRFELGAELVFNRKQGCYHYADNAFTLPAQWLTERELAIVLIAERALRMFTGSSFGKEIHLAFNRLLDPIRHDRKAVAYIRDLCNSVHFHLPFSSAKDVSPEFSLVLEAILDRRRIGMTYRSAQKAEAARREVDPYALVNNGGEWYLIGRCCQNDDVRTFVLANMGELTVLDARIAIPESFDVRAFLDQGFGRMHGTEAQSIRLRISRPASSWVARSIWHPSQQVIKRGSGIIELRLACAATDNLVRWIMQLGECVRVLAPRDLRDQVARRAGALARNNGR
jgi:predicted DNA-binding transcriptional regulator YafY